jgi:hypothetical protein
MQKRIVKMTSFVSVALFFLGVCVMDSPAGVLCRRHVERERTVFRRWTLLGPMQFHRRVVRDFEQSSNVPSSFFHSETTIAVPPSVIGENERAVCPPAGPCINSDDSGKIILPLAMPPKRIDDVGGYLEEGQGL